MANNPAKINSLTTGTTTDSYYNGATGTTFGSAVIPNTTLGYGLDVICVTYMCAYNAGYSGLSMSSPVITDTTNSITYTVSGGGPYAGDGGQNPSNGAAGALYCGAAVYIGWAVIPVAKLQAARSITCTAVGVYPPSGHAGSGPAHVWINQYTFAGTVSGLNSGIVSNSYTPTSCAMNNTTTRYSPYFNTTFYNGYTYRIDSYVNSLVVGAYVDTMNTWASYCGVVGPSGGGQAAGAPSPLWTPAPAGTMLSQTIATGPGAANFIAVTPNFDFPVLLGNNCTNAYPPTIAQAGIVALMFSGY